MNGHPRALMKTILRQCEAPVEIYNLQASHHRFVGLHGRVWLTKGQISKTSPTRNDFWNFFWMLISIQAVQGDTREGPEPLPELKKAEYW